MKFFDLTVQYRHIRREILQALQKVFEGGVFVGGEAVESFEKEMARFCGTKHAIGVNSGTDALLLSLKALGVGPGDEVITSPFTFIATVSVIENVGAKPVFVDIDPETFVIDPLKVEEKINKKTKAIIPVHLFGQMAEMRSILSLASRYRFAVIEDAAQAIGAEYRGRKAGSLGDAGCFSFFPSKNLGACGDGGMVVTNKKKLADTIRLLRSHGSSSKEKYRNLAVGANSRLDAIQAAILHVKLKYLDRWNKMRGERARFYSKGLQGFEFLQAPFIAKGRTHIFHQYTMRVKNNMRAELAAHLKKSGVPTMVYYPLPLHLQPALAHFGYRKGDFPEAEKVAKEVLSLPLYPELSRRDQDFIIQQIKKFYNTSFRIPI